MTPLEILEFMADGRQRLPTDFYKHFGLSGKYDLRAARLDNTCLDLVLQCRMCEPNGPFRELAITPVGQEYLIELREAVAHAARERQRLEQEAIMAEHRRLAEIARQEQQAARPKQKALFGG